MDGAADELSSVRVAPPIRVLRAHLKFGMVKSHLPIKSWACIGATSGLATILWLVSRYAGLFHPDVRGLIACCTATVITTAAAYAVDR